VIESIRERFLGRFVQGGRERVRRAREACEGEPCSLATVATELHALAGEAALLELTVVAELAQRGEAMARSAGAAPEGCVELLRELDRAVAALFLATDEGGGR
jgi:HPt (histidine-containing phosphotransfer) domain-containing protein